MSSRMPNDLDKLAEKIKKCRLCRLCKLAKNAVPGEGNFQAEIMFIGEAPGRLEDDQGRPFVGAAGKLLNKLLEEAGLQREDVFITSIIKHRPPENRDPLPDEIEACAPYLEEQIKIVQPKLIVTLGRHAMNKFLPGERISQVHGKIKRLKVLFSKKLIIFPMYHPASALYNPGLRTTLLKDINKIPTLLNKL